MLLIPIKRERLHLLSNLSRSLAFAGPLFLTHCQIGPQDETRQIIPNADNMVTLTEAQFENAPVETTQISEKNIATILKLNGKIDVPPQSLVSVSAPLGGYLKTTRLLPGMHISKGETIAVMEDPQYVRLQQDYLQAKSKHKFAELDYERQKVLNQSQAASDKVMQQAAAEMSNQRIVANALAVQLRLINVDPDKLTENTIAKSVPVYSQISGYVSKVNVNIGKYVNPADILFELIDPSNVHLNLKVYEKDIGKLHIGQKLLAYTNTEPGKKYQGEIILVNKNIGSDGISDVHCHIGQHDKALLPGMYMNAEIEIRSSTSHALPEESIVNFEGKDYVFVQTAKRNFKMEPVTVGENENGFVDILNSPDFSGKNVVTRNAYTLLMKLKNTSDEK